MFNDGGNVAIRNSTLSGNSVSNGFGPVVARSFGGGIYAKNGLLTIDNSTITNSNAASGRESICHRHWRRTNGHGTNPQFDHRPVRCDSLLRMILTPPTIQAAKSLVTGSNNLIRSQNFFRVDHDIVRRSAARPIGARMADQLSLTRCIGRQSRDWPRLKSAEPRQ